VSSSTEVLVIGAGVLGLSTAAELLRRGHAVTVVDPDTGNASAVAAGMIAPAFEALADWRSSDGRLDRGELFRAARSQWSAFAIAFDLPLHREGAEWRGPDLETVASQLRWLGFPAERTGDAVLTPADWRTEPVAALTRLRSLPGLSVIVGRVCRLTTEGARWTAMLEDGSGLAAKAVVLATGAVSGLDLPEPVVGLVARVQPIRGQIAVTDRHLVDRPVRGPAGYVAPCPGGAVIGATMDFDRTDLEPDLYRGEGLVRACLAQIGLSEDVPVTWRVGVRGTTPDGLPMAGPSGLSGLHLALAPRRNGWLLGPKVARTVVDGIEGRAAGPFAPALDPRRFA
jgi:glycine oxidase